MIRAIIDTNILVSAMISSVGNEALLILAINHGLDKRHFPQSQLPDCKVVSAGELMSFLTLDW
jgi:predicted nucleic acid-binding protein